MTPVPSLVDVREGAELLVIGGVPRSGKTMLTRRLWNDFRIPGLCMDAVVSSFVQIAPEAGINWVETPVRAQKMLTASQMVAIPSLQTFGRYFIEGESMTPIVADALHKNFQIRSCFLTMHSPRIDDIIRYEGDDAWVKDIAEPDRPVFVEQIVERSEWLAAQCKKFELPCIDMTEGIYAERAAEVVAMLTQPQLREARIS